MKLFQLPIKIILISTWLLIATNPVRSQSGNMSDITMPNPGEMTPDTPTEDGIVEEIVPEENTETPTDGVTGEETETPTDGVTGEETDIPTDEVVGEETDTPTDEVVGEETDTPTDEVVGEETDIPTDEVVGEETETPTDEVIGEETDIPTDEVIGEETDIPTDEVIGEETETPTDEVVGEETDIPTNEVIGEETDIPTNEVIGEETDTPTDEVIGEETETPTDEVIGEETETPTDEVIGEENTVEDVISDREIVNENVADAIADESQPFDGDVNLEENLQNYDNEIDSDVISEENTTDDLEIAAESDITTQTQSDSIEETDTNLDSESENTSQIDIEDSSEQNLEIADESDSQSTPTELEAQEEVDNSIATDSLEASEEIETETTTTEESSEVETDIEDELIEKLTEEEVEISQEETTTSEETEEQEDSVTEEKAEETEEADSSRDLGQEVDRIAYEVQVQESPTDVAIQMQEEFQLTQLMDTYGLQLYGQVPSVKDISQRLAELGQQTGKNPAFVNISLQSDRLEAFVVLPNEVKSSSSNNSLVASTQNNKINSSGKPKALTLRETIKDTSRQDVIATATQFREEISDSSKLNQSSYMKSAQELYKILIEPIEAELEANNIDILVFSMDSGLRLLPLAALHDGEQFLIEKYAVAIVPSFGLTDTRYVNLDGSSILAMGASEFAEQAALPTMPIELEAIVRKPRHGEVFLNEQFTVDNFKAQNKRETSFPIVHLGTHAEFKAGDLNDSYIQFYDDKLRIPQLQELSNELGWDTNATPVELLVLSACETALGDEQAELGFAGLAVQAGVKSALASLWYVSDVGTLALMGEFYDRLDDTLIKAEALRQTQLKMLEGSVRVENQQVKLSNGEGLGLPPQFPNGTLTLSHPYFWSAFTLIGNWN